MPATPGTPGLPPSTPTGSGKCGVPLRHRRGLDIGIPAHVKDFPNQKRLAARDKFQSNESLLSSSPAVVSETEPSGADSHVMPGAFPCCRTVFFFDWDDTLCPTTWIRETLKNEMADSIDWAMSAEEFDKDWRYSIPAWFGQPLPDMPHIKDKIWSMQRAVIKVIEMAQSLGVVCIVTNACEGWVEKTTKKWLPHLTEYVFGHGSRPPIQVLYGQLEYKSPPPGSVADSLQFVDGLRDLMLWKKVAMQTALEHVDTLYRINPSRVSDEHQPSLPRTRSGSCLRWNPLHRDNTPRGSTASSHFAWPAPGDHENVPTQVLRQPNLKVNAANVLVNIISVGDTEAEMQSAELAAVAYREAVRQPSGSSKRAQSAPAALRMPAGRPWVKQLKLREGPSLDAMVQQLDVITKSLMRVVAARSHLRLTPEEMLEWTPEDCCCNSIPEARVQRKMQLKMRMQSI
jgi:hypothetical protein